MFSEKIPLPEKDEIEWNRINKKYLESKQNYNEIEKQVAQLNSVIIKLTIERNTRRTENLSESTENTEKLKEAQSKLSQAFETRKHLRLRLLQAAEARKEYCTRQNIYQLYVMKGLGGDLQPSCEAICLFAKHNNLSVYIWQKEQSEHDEEQSKINLLKYHTVENPKDIEDLKHYIHLLFTQNFTRLNLSSIAPSPEKEIYSTESESSKVDPRKLAERLHINDMPICLEEVKIQLTDADDTSEQEFLEKIRIALSTYQEAYRAGKHTKEQLQTIIDACETYIKRIPFKLTSGEGQPERLVKLPRIIEVLKIQRKAVNNYFLPDAPNNTKARWKLLSDLHQMTEPDNIRGKMLQSNYWIEYKYQGRISIADWVNCSINDTNEYFQSFYEAIEEEKNILGVDKRDVFYFDDPTPYEVTFKDGLTYIHEGKTLLDTLQKEGGANIELEECIFSVSLDGKLYVNDPAKYLESGFHHSSFLKGQRVICSGTLRVEKGAIKEITNISGHYLPNTKELIDLLKFLQANHVDLSQTDVQNGPEELPRSAIRFFKYQGYLLPSKEDRGQALYEIAMSKKIMSDKDGHVFFLNKAVEENHSQAMLEKGRNLILGENGYSKNKEEGETLLKKLISLNTTEKGEAEKFLALHSLEFSSDIDSIIKRIDEKILQQARFLNPTELKQLHQEVLDIIQPIIEKSKDLEELYNVFKRVKDKKQDWNKLPHAIWSQLIDKIKEKAYQTAQEYVKMRIEIDFTKKNKYMEIFWTGSVKTRHYFNDFLSLVGDVQPSTKLEK